MAMLSLILLTLLTTVSYRYSGADALDGWWLRARFSLREWPKNQRTWLNTWLLPKLKIQSAISPKDPRIVLVEIDDKSVDLWNQEPFILWGGHLASAIKQLNRSGARLVALDWLQSVNTDARFQSDNDDILGQALHETKNVVLVKFIAGKYIRPAPSLLYALPDAYKDGGESYLGFAELFNSSGVQSTFLPRLPASISPKPEISFASRIAQKSGFAVPSNQPLRPDGSLLINFANNIGSTSNDSPYDRVSLYDVANSKKPDPRFKDKIVFIGSTYKGHNDRHFVPFLGDNVFSSRLVPGVEVQMNAVLTLLDDSAIGEPNEAMVWLTTLALGAIGVFIYAYLNWARAARIVGILMGVWATVSFTMFVGADFAFPLVLPLGSLLFGCALMGGYRALSEERERRQVMKIWGRYQDPRLIQELLEHPDLRSGQGREVEVTVLFADLKNFTRTVESLSPAKALEALNKYLALLARVIRAHGGIVDKYLGDGLMAQWGAPVAHPDHATAAVRACLEIEKQVEALTQTLNTSKQVTFEVRLTLHSGLVIAGPLGAEEKLEYTIIGDTVNVTSRLQETSKALGCDFLISETTRAALKCEVHTGRETEVEIRGRKAPLRVFEILDDRTAVPGTTPTPRERNHGNGQNVST